MLTRILFERGESELAISLLTSKEEDTFYSRMKKGGTTIPEYWTGHRSQCHPMFGAVSQYLFEYVLGIRQKVPEKTKALVLLNGKEKAIGDGEKWLRMER